MTEPNLAGPKPLLERLGVRYFERRSLGRPLQAQEDEIHILNDTERAGLRRVERGAVLRAASIGAMSAFISALAEVFAERTQVDSSHQSQLRYWLVLGSVTLVATVIEIALIYWDTLRSVHALSEVAGLQLFETGEGSSQLPIADALARAALELPNPVEGPYGIHARKEASRLKYVVASIAYKAKVGVTNFILKLLVRRILSRVAVRSLSNVILPFVAIPVTAVWNGIVSYRVLREATVRAMGPSAVAEAVASLGAVNLSTAEAMLRAVATAIVRTEDWHPNLLALLMEVRAKGRAQPVHQVDDGSHFLQLVALLSKAAQRQCLAVLLLACVVDGRLSSRERRLCRQAFEAAGETFHAHRLELARRRFLRGQGLRVGDVFESSAP
jgi:putative flippase GtrA